MPVPDEPTMTRLIDGPPSNAKRLLLPFVVAILLAMIALQGLLALASWRALLPAILFVCIATGTLIWFWINRVKLAQIPFGFLIAHVMLLVSFGATNNLSVLLSLVTLTSDGATIEQAQQAVIGTPWFQWTFWGGWVWSVGLLSHLVVSVSLGNRGVR
jgi:hypothetical protein